MNELSTTANFRIDEGFKKLIPPLSPEEFSILEKECAEYGIRDALVVASFPGSNGLVLIDGHNRYGISKKHNISFKTIRVDFQSREDAEAYIIRNQLGRRNISLFVRAELALKLKPVIAEKAEKNLHLAEGKGCQKSDKVNAIDTKKELAKVANVSHDTIHKVEVIKEKAHDLDPRTIEDLRRGDVSINKVYSDIKASEHENIRQQEARELREAKKRVESFENSKVVAIGEAKQNKDDNKLIFEEFSETVHKATMAILHMAIKLDEKTVTKAIKATSNEELRKVLNDLQEDYKTILKVQRKIAEVLDEK